MKANFTLFDPIQVEGKCAVMTGEDTDVKATQFRGSDETLAGSFHNRDLRRLRSLYEIQPGLSLCVYPMAGSST
jgi:hypothetical protein